MILQLLYIVSSSKVFTNTIHGSGSKIFTTIIHGSDSKIVTNIIKYKELLTHNAEVSCSSFHTGEAISGHVITQLVRTVGAAVLSTVFTIISLVTPLMYIGNGKNMETRYDTDKKQGGTETTTDLFTATT